LYREQPLNDSGLKTIAAAVTDAEGQTAAASVDVYTILDVGRSGWPLHGGKTYRVAGLLITIPEGVEMQIGGVESSGTGAGVRGRHFMDLIVTNLPSHPHYSSFLWQFLCTTSER